MRSNEHRTYASLARANWMLLLVLALTARPTWQARADETKAAAQNGPQAAEEGEPPVLYKLTLSPVAEPQPALKFRLLIPPVDQAHANAATYYYKALLVEGTEWLDRLYNDDKVGAWVETPNGGPPPAEAKEKVTPVTSRVFQAALREATRADSCDWGDAGTELGGHTPRPELSALRKLAFALHVLARIQIAEHHTSEALDTLRIGYTLGRNLSHGPSFVHVSDGSAVIGMMHQATRDLLAAPDSPNLYWALTELGYQPSEPRRALSFDARLWQVDHPQLSKLDREIFSPEEALDLARKLYNESGPLLGRIMPPWDSRHEAALLFETMALLPEARAYLDQHGFTSDRIDAMPLLQQVLLYRWKEFVAKQDDLLKWTLLAGKLSPNQVLQAVEKQLPTNLDIGQPFSLFFGASSDAARLVVLHERALGMLSTIEALRMYAAEHNAWPQKLDDVTVVPIPLDAATEKPFEYSVDGDVARLGAPSVQHRPEVPMLAVQYQTTLRRPPETTAPRNSGNEPE
ncbi:MAG TPA: hypothetical protein VMF30_11995 [Pirellulales bacterium]|nr:hypothetical protein [Pirellulales bacterium]